MEYNALDDVWRLGQLLPYVGVKRLYLRLWQWHAVLVRHVDVRVFFFALRHLKGGLSLFGICGRLRSGLRKLTLGFG